MIRVGNLGGLTRPGWAHNRPREKLDQAGPNLGHASFVLAQPSSMLGQRANGPAPPEK